MIRQFARTVTDQKPFEVALERMQAVAGQVEFSRRCRLIEDGQYFLDCIRKIGSYSATVVALVKAFEATMFKAPDH